MLDHSIPKLRRLLLTGLIVLLVGACGEQPDATQPILSRVVDGREVFRGVFFGEGVIGDRLGMIWEGKSVLARLPNEEMRIRASTSLDALVESLAAKDRHFFSRFGDEMQSGEPLRVQAALLDAAARTQGSPMLAGAAPNETEASIIYQIVHSYQVYFFYESVAVYRAAVAIEAAVVTSRIPELVNSKSALQRDVVVADIARSLAVR